MTIDQPAFMIACERFCLMRIACWNSPRAHGFSKRWADSLAVQPKAIAIPATSQDVIEIVKLCHEYKVPFVARGSGTSLSGGSLPHADGIVIALNRLDRILRLDLPSA